MVGEDAVVVHNSCPKAWEEFLDNFPDADLDFFRKAMKSWAGKFREADLVKCAKKYGNKIKICYDDFGFPHLADFAANLEGIEGIIEINMKGDDADFTQANEEFRKKINQKVGFEKYPPNSKFDRTDGVLNAIDDFPYTWHHHQDGKHMILIPKEIHEKSFPHIGGNKIMGTLVKKYPDLVNKLPTLDNISQFLNCK